MFTLLPLPFCVSAAKCTVERTGRPADCHCSVAITVNSSGGAGTRTGGTTPRNTITARWPLQLLPPRPPRWPRPTASGRTNGATAPRPECRWPWCCSCWPVTSVWARPCSPPGRAGRSSTARTSASSRCPRSGSATWCRASRSRAPTRKTVSCSWSRAAVTCCSAWS